MEKRVDPWGDFLRRLLLSASLAGTALPATAAEDTGAGQEVTEPETPAQPPAAMATAEEPARAV